MSTYDLHPVVNVYGHSDAWQGYGPIIEQLRLVRRAGQHLIVDCYPGADEAELMLNLVLPLKPSRVICMHTLMKTPDELRDMLEPALTEDRVLGRMMPFEMESFFNEAQMNEAKVILRGCGDEFIAVVGVGASLLSDDGLRVYADMARWEIQLRYRKGLSNWGAENEDEDFLRKYKRAYFIEWRTNDRHKARYFRSFDFIMDVNSQMNPRMATVQAILDGLSQCTERPFRLVPFFDPGVWGGQWMRERFGLPADAPNYAWCFDCVPEENSLRLSIGEVTLELPAMDLTLLFPTALLGERVVDWFGAEFPIRFDLLDTMGGQNLSLQVHPKRSYIRNQFGMDYTQDESYYILDADEDAVVYLGLRNGAKLAELTEALETAQQTAQFDVSRYVNEIPTKTHDHFLIPAGTLHGAGANTMVLEISATPFIFTFKLWDWGRLGLDGKPRPIHLTHGCANLIEHRNGDWVARECYNQFEPLSETEEKTGLHPLEFIETHRHTFAQSVGIPDVGSVQVMNLVEGREVIVESVDGSFAPFTVHYAETFILPAQARGCRLVPPPNETVRVIRAYVREGA